MCVWGSGDQPVAEVARIRWAVYGEFIQYLPYPPSQFLGQGQGSQIRSRLLIPTLIHKSRTYRVLPIRPDNWLPIRPRLKVQEADEQKMNRMTGLTRLFAALASSDCPPGSNKHPFGLENIWKTLVAILICESLKLYLKLAVIRSKYCPSIRSK